MSDTSNDMVEIPYDSIVARRAKATCYRVDDIDAWIPTSQISEDNGESITIPEWLAIEKGLDGYV